jgi:hypothetical protein
MAARASLGASTTVHPTRHQLRKRAEPAVKKFKPSKRKLIAEFAIPWDLQARYSATNKQERAGRPPQYGPAFYPGGPIGGRATPPITTPDRAAEILSRAVALAKRVPQC